MRTPASLTSTIAVITLSLMRRGALPLLVVTLSVPAAVATIYVLLPIAAREQATLVAGVFSGHNYYAVGVDGRARIFFGEVTSRNVSTDAYVIFADEDFIHNHAPSLTGRCGSMGKRWASVGVTLSSLLAVGVGDHIEVCVGEQCVTYVIACINRGEGVLRASAIIVGENPPVEGGWGLSTGKSGPMVRELISGLNRFLRGFSDVITLFIAVAYFPVAYIGVRRTIELVSDSIASLRALGVNASVTRFGVFASIIILSIASAFFGLGLGTLMTHVGAWAATLFGAMVGVRPVPDAWAATLVLGSVLGEGCVAAAVAVVWGDLLWEGRW